MVRMKKSMEGHEEAVKSWYETMEKKYGNISDFMKKIGAKGGKNGHGGGFTNSELARKAGAKGGLKSKRGASLEPEWQAKKALARQYYDEGDSIIDIARKIEMPYTTTLRRIRKGLEDGTF